MKITIEQLVARKKDGLKVTMLTSYDYPTACILDKCGVDVQLVGDSLGTNLLGYEDVSSVTMADMLHHLKAVVRGVKNSFILCDMPYDSCRTNSLALDNSLIFMEAGADGVKIESEKHAIDTIAYVASTGIPVCAHIGYTPQTPGLKPVVQGRDEARAAELISLAEESEKAGAFMIVLELIPEKLARYITESISIPTIGIGAGRFCDGQVQVILDIMGVYEKKFRHVKRYSDLHSFYSDAVLSYMKEVQDGYFPEEENSAIMPEEVLRAVINSRKERK